MSVDIGLDKSGYQEKYGYFLVEKSALSRAMVDMYNKRSLRLTHTESLLPAWRTIGFFIVRSAPSINWSEFVMCGLIWIFLTHVTRYSRTSLAWTSLGLWTFVWDMGSSSHLGLIIAPGQEAYWDNLGKYFLFFIQKMVCWVYSLELPHWVNSNGYTQQKFWN